MYMLKEVYVVSLSHNMLILLYKMNNILLEWISILLLHCYIPTKKLSFRWLQYWVVQNSDILISSPYTRTMQTASIIAKRHNLDINAEPLLHEWIPDLSNNYNTEEEFLELIRTAKCDWELKKRNHNHICSFKTEALDHVQERAIEALSKYLDYNKVIVVSHGLLISTLFKEKVRLQTAGFIMVTDNEINENLKQIGMGKTLCKK